MTDIRAHKDRAAKFLTAGKFDLAAREFAEAVAADPRDVATRLSLAEGTVKHHLSNVFDKLGVKAPV